MSHDEKAVQTIADTIRNYSTWNGYADRLAREALEKLKALGWREPESK